MASTLFHFQIIRAREGEEGDSTNVRRALPTKCTDDMEMELDNLAFRQAHGGIPPTSTITTREAFAWVTVEGARMLKQSHRIGSLAAGKQADLVMLRASDLNMQPVHDAVSTVVMQTSLANIDSVMVAGQYKKRHGQLLNVDLRPKLAALKTSGQKIVAALGL